MPVPSKMRERRALPRGHLGLFNYLTRLADGLGLRLDAGTQNASETGVKLQA